MTDTIIIGGGLAGLCAAVHLKKRGKQYLLLEASDRVGGRVKTDQKDGFLLDHGFQVLLTEYPEAKAMLDYEKLKLKEFDPGALILQANGSMDHIGDPLRQWNTLFRTVSADVGSLFDKLKILRLRNHLARRSMEEIFQQEEMTTAAYLQKFGFSPKIIKRFFSPFFGGIFLENNLSSSARMFEFVFKLFSKGDAAIPEKGMEQIPLQLAGQLDPASILCGQKVVQVDGSEVITDAGQSFQAKNIILATQATALPVPQRNNYKQKAQSVTNVYFSSPSLPFTKPLIALNPNTSQLVNNICVLDRISTAYAPQGQHLISVSVNGIHGSGGLTDIIKKELTTWFGPAVQDWQQLKTYCIPYALPDQSSVRDTLSPSELKLSEKLYICGDHLLQGSINAAMKSGRLVAEMLD